MSIANGFNVGVSASQRFEGDHRCPICKGTADDPRGNGSRCFGFLSGDGQWAHCTREDHAGRAVFNPKTNSYQHKVKGPCPCHAEHAPADPGTTNGKPKAQSRGTIFAIYPYHRTAAGPVDFEVVRTKDPKGFFQRRKASGGKWITKGVFDGFDPCLYRRPELLAAPPDEVVLVVEGEKDAGNLAALGFVTTCNPMGAKKWRDAYSEDLRGRRVAILPDNDQDGRDHALQVARSLWSKAADVRIVSIPGLPEKGDATDFLKAGGTADDLRRMIAGAAPWEPGEPEEQPESPKAETSSNGDGHHTGEETAAAGPSVKPKPSPQAIEAPDDPHRLAGVIRKPFVDAEGNATLACYRGGFYVWDGTRYRLDPIFVTKTVVDESKAEIDRQNIAAQVAHTGDGAPPTAKKVTTGLVKNVVQALTAMCCIDREGDAPFWINRQDDDPDPRDIISAHNGLIDISGTDPVLMTHTPRFFSTHALGYDFDPDFGEPKKWNAFLRAQWPADDESIYTLHEVLGDMLSPTEGIHALHLWIGPPRSGRGTMREVASDLVGRWNVTATSPVSLSSSFGLESLLDKKLAVMGDARTGDSHDSAVMMDRLLRITGGDPVEVNRKGRPILPDVRMNLRMLVISNEMPNFRDASGAIVSRYVVLATTKTIPKEERNPTLAAELKAELPGILNEAIESLKTLRQRKHFLQPKSSEHLIDDAGDIASPVRVFVAERKCPLGADHSVPTATLFDDWRHWAIANGYQVGNIGTFGKNLKAAYPHVRKTRPRDGDKQVSTYEEIGRGLPF